jgi:multisubunit Na+/H+ antiporter MnhB subunit
MSRMASRSAALGLVLLMTLASLMLWVGIPLAWLFIGSRLVKSSQPSMGPYMLVAVGIIVSVIVDALVISRLNRRYMEVTGTRGRVRVQLPWLKSMRGERDRGRDMSVLDVILIATVGLAMTAFGIWFFFFAGSSLPT